MQNAQMQEITTAQQTFLTKVYAWMVGGLLATGLTAGFVVTSPTMLEILFGSRIVFFALIIGEFALVAALAGWVEKMSATTATLAFLGYSILNGLTLSVIFMVYTDESISSTFMIAAGMFGAMSAYGYLTKRDLSGVGSFMFMGLIGIIIASVVNIFMSSSALYFAISIIGILVFVGLTAYDTQKIKEQNWMLEGGDEAVIRKAAIRGALTLYLDFINLFLFLLRLLGNRR